MEAFKDDLHTPLPTPEQPVVQVEVSAEAVQVDNEPAPTPRPHQFHGVHSRGTVRTDITNGPWVDKYGQRTDKKPMFDPPQKAVRYDPNVNYTRDPRNQGSDESGRAYEVRGGKVFYKASGEEVKSGATESLSSFGCLVPKMTSRRI